ncbi:MAG TPA: PcfJ domain-containing protein, partial [Candidatus Paceibacterota bacterium]|nr:PcfJ domain-containing protein [Candidatus Paceibacterota bacterium]
MPPKRFQGKFGIPPSHPVWSLLTQALYRLPESISPEQVERMSNDIADKVNAELSNEGKENLSENELRTLQLKLVRHFEDNGDSAPIDIPTIVDALLESPKFLQSDKGSIAKLFELHEMKTLQRIAELRRQKAELTNGETFNPYENLFETASGKYYLARLLNMPHLEEESTYMDHCVGTSSSYISKMKRGDVEILSFRDKTTHEPIVTIEYDCRSKRLLQVKAFKDRIPTLGDDFSADLIEAIERLGETTNDKNESREVKSPEAVHLRHLLNLKDKQTKGEVFTKDDLVFLYELNEPIKGFDTDDREPLIDKIRKDRNVKEDMLVIFSDTEEPIRPDQIAHVQSDITENIKAYV